MHYAVTTSVKAKATSTCCRSIARKRTTDESTFTKLSSTRNLFNIGEQSPNRWSIIFKCNSLMLPLMYLSFAASAKAKARTWPARPRQGLQRQGQIQSQNQLAYRVVHGVGWPIRVGLGWIQIFPLVMDGLGWIGSHKMDPPRTTLA